jgi:hypothetical protein
LSDQLYALTIFFCKKKLWYILKRRWVGPRAGLGVLENRKISLMLRIKPNCIECPQCVFTVPAMFFWLRSS